MGQSYITVLLLLVVAVAILGAFSQPIASSGFLFFVGAAVLATILLVMPMLTDHDL